MLAFYKISVVLLLISTAMPSYAEANQNSPLRLSQAILMALENDALIQSLSAKQDSWNQLSHAANTWKDPKLRFGAQAVPIDTFNLDQEPMTQLVFGYQQQFPRGDSLKHQSSISDASSSIEASKIESRKRQIIMLVEKNWYEIAYRKKAIHIIELNQQVFEEIRNINQDFYAVGRANQQSVIQAELDISLLDDKLQNMLSELEVVKEELAKWLGVYVTQLETESVNQSVYKIKTLDELLSTIKLHPRLKQAQADLNKNKNALALEQDKYSAEWGVDVRYGYRQAERSDGTDFPDFLTAMVTVDLPIFTEQKQDRHVAASKSRVQSARYQMIDMERELIKELKQTHARLVKYKQRLTSYSARINPQAKQNTEVAMSGYQSGVVDFLTLSKAQVTEFNTLLAELKLQYQFNVTQSKLSFLVGTHNETK